MAGKMAKASWGHEESQRRNSCISTLIVLYNVLFTCVVVVGGYHLLHKMNSLQLEVDILKNEKLTFVKEINIGQAPADSVKQEYFGRSDQAPLPGSHQSPDDNSKPAPVHRFEQALAENEHSTQRLMNISRAKREILSGSSKEGTATRSETVTANFEPAIRQIVNITAREILRQEWSTLLSTLPNYGGATYIRWGSKNCSGESSLIYSGLSAGTASESLGGGANYLCLPSDPKYNPSFSKTNYVKLSIVGKTIYDDWSMRPFFGEHVMRKRLACAVCEAQHRLTKVTIPAMTTCPDDSWTLEYEGLLVSQLSHYDTGKINNNNNNNNNKNKHYKSTFECLDLNPQKFKSTDNVNAFGGDAMYLVTSSCSGADSLDHCPPYKRGQPLSCVVCTK